MPLRLRLCVTNWTAELRVKGLTRLTRHTYAQRMGQPTQRATNYTARSKIDTAQIFLHANGQRPKRAPMRQRSQRRQRRGEPHTEHGLGVRVCVCVCVKLYICCAGVELFFVSRVLRARPKWRIRVARKNIRVFFSDWAGSCEYINLDYVCIHVIYRVKQAEYVILWNTRIPIPHVSCACASIRAFITAHVNRRDFLSGCPGTLRVEYEARRKQYGILFILSLFCEYVNLVCMPYTGLPRRNTLFVFLCLRHRNTWIRFPHVGRPPARGLTDPWPLHDIAITNILWHALQ